MLSFLVWSIYMIRWIWIVKCLALLHPGLYGWGQNCQKLTTSNFHLISSSLFPHKLEKNSIHTYKDINSCSSILFNISSSCPWFVWKDAAAKILYIMLTLQFIHTLDLWTGILVHDMCFAFYSNTCFSYPSLYHIYSISMPFTSLILNVYLWIHVHLTNSWLYYFIL